MNKKFVAILVSVFIVCGIMLTTGMAEANPDGTVEIAQIIHPTTASLYADDVALFNWLADYDTNVTQIRILDMEGESTGYWTQFNVVILPGGCGLVPIGDLVSSEVPVIAMSTGHADELGLGTGVGTLHASTRDFYVRDNTHPITTGLDLDAWTWSGTGYMWTDATDNAGYTEATVLVDNGEVGKDILIVHQTETKKYAFFGWYRASQWPDEGWSLMEKTIEWAIGRSLPPFSMEFTVEITAPATIYKPGDTINIVVNTDKAGYTVTGSFSNLYYTPKMAGISYNTDTWQYSDVEYWMDTYLGSLGYTVEKIAQQTVETHSFEEWEAYDVVFISEGFASSHDLTNLIDSTVPIIMTGNDDDYVPQAGLGDGTYNREDKQTFYVVDNTHPITQGLFLGELTFASSMWTTRIGTSDCDVTVLIDDNDSLAKAYLATRQDPKRVWFGYYRGTQAGPEANGIFSNSIAWTLGRSSLPGIKADATDNGDGIYSISYTIGDAPLFEIINTILITVEDAVGHIATDDSLSVTIMPAPAEAWVDDDWNSQADVNAFDSSLIWQYDAFASIQAGIDAVAEGGTVNVAAGTYSTVTNGESFPITISESLTLKGAQFGTDPTVSGARTDESQESVIDASDAIGNAIEIEANNVILDGFTVKNVPKDTKYGIVVLPQSDDHSIYSSDITIQNNILTDNNRGMKLVDNENSLVKKNLITRCNSDITTSNGGSGIVLSYVKPTTQVTENLLTENVAGNTYYGPILVMYGRQYTQPTITKNLITNNHRECPASWGILVLDASAIIRDNIIKENDMRGIGTMWGTADIPTILIEDNEITGNSQRGIEITIGTFAVSVTGNTISDNGGTGIDVQSGITTDVSIHYNNIFGNGGGVSSPTLSIDAENNWWGSAKPDFNNIVSDNVNYSPWYTNQEMTSLAGTPENNQLTLPTEVEINVTTSVGEVTVEIPAEITITGEEGWAGEINAPTFESISSVTVIPERRKTATVSAVIEIGYGDIKLTFNKAVRIAIVGQGGKYAGYSRSGIFTPITTICTADTQDVGNDLPAEGDCKIDVWPDLVIWTKHFTKFVAYTQTAIVPRGGGTTGIDTIAPSISGIEVLARSDKATITWKTNESSLAWIVYGTSTDYGEESKTTSYTTSHSVTLSDLSPETTYHYQIKSKDSNGNIGSYTDKTFTTLALEEKITGDINGDNKVDISDFNLLIVNWGDSPSNLAADLDGNGKVDISDFNLLMVNWW